MPWNVVVGVKADLFRLPRPLPDARRHPFRHLPRSDLFSAVLRSDVSPIIRLTVRDDRLSRLLPSRLPFSLTLPPPRLIPWNSQIPPSNFSRPRRFLSVSAGHYSRDVAHGGHKREPWENPRPGGIDQDVIVRNSPSVPRRISG